MSESINVTPQFVLAGEATFTVSNGKGKHYTYHVYTVEPTAKFPTRAWFIKVLKGPDNTDPDKSYAYMGKLKWTGPVWGEMDYTRSTTPPQIKTTAMSKYRDTAECLKVARWALRAIWQVAYNEYQLPPDMSIKHVGRCGKCGAKLTTPQSLDTGFGPGCAANLGIPWEEKTNTVSDSSSYELNFRMTNPAAGGM